ncbi:hypothetical protein P7K49_009256 [Saguinus oedipus]|uniref:Uncharacterized protein n=1 Tax=Saguinus oedipus TaxID=9490 RepID=A0ABQ9VK34_SAGOE|nr:hypothetical protein P7K49_009256 [Saguinus oedipus]
MPTAEKTSSRARSPGPRLEAAPPAPAARGLPQDPGTRRAGARRPWVHPFLDPVTPERRPYRSAGVVLADPHPGSWAGPGAAGPKRARSVVIAPQPPLPKPYAETLRPPRRKSPGARPRRNPGAGVLLPGHELLCNGSSFLWRPAAGIASQLL